MTSCAKRTGMAASSIRVGMPGRDADALARTTLTRCGFGDAFGHSLGHGIGLEVHEAPRLARTADAQLVAGAVVTIEPGIYRAGVGRRTYRGRRPSREPTARRCLRTFHAELIELESEHASGEPITLMIDLRYVKKLLEMLDESTVDSVEISSDKGVKISISKSPHAARRGADAPMPLPDDRRSNAGRRRPTPAEAGCRRSPSEPPQAAAVDATSR